MKIVLIWRFSGLYFPTLKLNNGGYCASLHIQSQRGRVRSRGAPNLDTFHAVDILRLRLACWVYILQSL